MRDKDLYAQILGIKSPWQVSGVELALSEGEVTIHVEQEEGVQHCCPTCGEVSPGYDSRKRKWRHLDTPLCQHSCPLTSVSNYYLIRGRKEIMKCQDTAENSKRRLFRR